MIAAFTCIAIWMFFQVCIAKLSAIKEVYLVCSMSGSQT